MTLFLTTLISLTLNPIRNLQPPLQMPLGSNNLILPFLTQPQPLPLTPQLLLPLPLTPKLFNQRTRHSLQPHVIQRVTKIRHAIPLLSTAKRHTMHRRLEQPIRPIAQQIPNVNQNRRML